ncbi:MAG: enoyl-CoA hydratase/isomerase family protein [Betaproteobacteria bacterium]|nr:enoyl-CoA hydratase/isomerase family protein [Betaproteobacteria bacterium]
MTEQTSAPVLFEEHLSTNGARIGVALLNAERSLNALTLRMIDLLGERLRAWASDPEIVLVILEGAGERAFCAGADLHQMHKTILAHHASPQCEDILGNAYALDFFTREYRLDYLIHTYPKPVLSWARGVVMGGGVGLAVGASHRVVTEHARVAMPEINIGLYADVGGSWFLNRAPGKTGLFLALTAAQLNASDAIFAGLADYQVEYAQKAQIMARILQHEWKGSAQANRHSLTSLLLEFAAKDLAHGPLRQHFGLVNTLCAQADIAGIVAAITGLKTEDAWLNRAAATLAAGSPGTAALSAALQQRLRLCSLAEVFRAELVASLVCAARPDLAEGIRALLIDKDRHPRWRPATLAEVTPGWIDGFFKSPWPAHEHPLADL